jgi:hypothetical protein
MGGFKLDQGKLRWDLLPPAALTELVRVYTYGLAKGYPARNWEAGMEWSRPFAALMRHAWAFWAGEDLDPESGLPHMAHAAWNALALVEYLLKGKGQDDRPQEKQ